MDEICVSLASPLYRSGTVYDVANRNDVRTSFPWGQATRSSELVMPPPSETPQ